MKKCLYLLFVGNAQQRRKLTIHIAFIFMYIDSLYPCKQEYTLDYVQRLQMMYKTGDYFDNAQ